jgi:hypothetical protein
MLGWCEGLSMSSERRAFICVSASFAPGDAASEKRGVGQDEQDLKDAGTGQEAP